MQYHQFQRDHDRFATLFQMISMTDADRAALVVEYKARSESAFAETTKRVLKQVIASFTVWCVTQGHSPSPPVSASVVASYVDSLAGKIKASTIETRLWAIGEMHKAEFYPSPCQDVLVRFAVRSIKRQHGAATRQAAPLGKREVMRILLRMGNTRRDLRDKALLWVASDSWCRSAEIVGLAVRDFLPQADASSLLFIRRSKTDPDGQGAYAYLSPPGTRAVQQWIDTAALKLEHPLFMSSQPNATKRPMDPATVSRIFKLRSGRKEVSAHSTRVGGVHDALLLGCDFASIMISGRWTSADMPAQYGRMILPSRSAAAKVSEAFSNQP
jgi:hypothetical protein